jgi:hypothetical protein
MRSWRIWIMAPSFAATVAVAPLAQAEIIASHSISVDFSQTELNPEELTVEGWVVCRYRSGILFPETKNCGSRTVEVGFDRNGALTWQSIEAFDHWRAHSVDNYEIGVSVVYRKQRLFSIGARGKNGIRELLSLKDPIRILKIKGGPVSLLIDGQDFFSSSWLQNDGAMLFGSATVNKGARPYRAFILASGILYTELGADNRNYTAPERQLRNRKGIVLRDFFHAYIEDDEARSMRIFFRYENAPGASAIKFSGGFEIPLTAEGLSKLEPIELKPAK